MMKLLVARAETLPVLAFSFTTRGTLPPAKKVDASHRVPRRIGIDITTRLYLHAIKWCGAAAGRIGFRLLTFWSLGFGCPCTFFSCPPLSALPCPAPLPCPALPGPVDLTFAAAATGPLLCCVFLLRAATHVR
ncbi:hypothetical protein IWX46DRAFT_458044 [Phyllosticta citricarpa]|uniref:Uncharacterized protein n=1 Tax=Phyllosticta citricarpa TaxID=55181 RepID=A0ABR1MHC5_9PEZI